MRSLVSVIPAARSGCSALNYEARFDSGSVACSPRKIPVVSVAAADIIKNILLKPEPTAPRIYADAFSYADGVNNFTFSNS